MLATTEILAEHLTDALAAIHRARELSCDVQHRETVHQELTSAELSLSRILVLISGQG